MTREECDVLVSALLRIGVLVEAVESQRDAPDRWQIVAWCANPLRRYVISDAARFRQAVHDGLSGVVPKGALD
jgi:hypothetical protein